MVKSVPLGIKTGVEPSPQMAERSRKFGLNVIEAVAEDLPFSDEEFDFVFMVIKTVNWASNTR